MHNLLTSENDLTNEKSTVHRYCEGKRTIRDTTMNIMNWDSSQDDDSKTKKTFKKRPSVAKWRHFGKQTPPLGHSI